MLYVLYTFTVYTQCDVNRCENGGICRKLATSYICTCTANYTGSLCEIFSKDDVNVYKLRMYYNMCVQYCGLFFQGTDLSFW